MIGWAESRTDVLLMFEDECWFSRFAQPGLHAWATTGEALRLVERDQENEDTEPKALACFGAVREDTKQVYLYFCAGQPNSAQTLVVLPWLIEVARREGKQVLVIIWDRASWHKSKTVREWVRKHNRQARQEGGVRIIAWMLPSKSPWLNPMEPRWVHARRAVVEPNGQMTAVELKRRLGAHFRTEPYMPTLKESQVELH